MSKPRIVVVGSSNIDMVVTTQRIPRCGETVLGGSFAMVPGGKGANQAVCAARLGAQVTLVARVGDDVFGRTSLQNFESVGVDTRFVKTDSNAPSGVALITVDEDGENAIVVAPGANAELRPSDVDEAADAIAVADAVVLQLEIPEDTVAHAVSMAHARGVRVVLNPAPIRTSAAELISKVDVLVPNQHEAAELLGRPGEGSVLNAEAAAAELRSRGAKSVVITLGSQGACFDGPGGSDRVDAMKVKPVDATAAGDAFTASLAVSLAEGSTLPEAAAFASRVAGIAVTRLGAQPSMPTRKEVQEFDFGG